MALRSWVTPEFKSTHSVSSGCEPDEISCASTLKTPPPTRVAAMIATSDTLCQVTSFRVAHCSGSLRFPSVRDILEIARTFVLSQSKDGEHPRPCPFEALAKEDDNFTSTSLSAGKFFFVYPSVAFFDPRSFSEVGSEGGAEYIRACESTHNF